MLYQLSYTHQKNPAMLRKQKRLVNSKNGAPGRIRTLGLRIRSPLLYPTELLAHRRLFFKKLPAEVGCVSSMRLQDLQIKFTRFFLNQSGQKTNPSREGNLCRIRGIPRHPVQSISGAGSSEKISIGKFFSSSFSSIICRSTTFSSGIGSSANGSANAKL